LASHPDQSRRLVELAALFLKLGTTSFGGPAAHIALMEDEVVRRRGWLSREELLDLIGAANLIPGPNSTELAIHIGHRRAGWPGLLTAGVSFILPAVLLVTAIAWAYVEYRSLPQLGWLLYGIKPVIIAIVVQALVRLGKTALKTSLLAAATVAAAAMALAGAHELLVIFGVGAAVAVLAALRRTRGGAGLVLLPAALSHRPETCLALGGVAAAGIAAFSRTTLFLVFLKIGSVLYGSGYVLLAFLRRDLVERLGWLSEAELLDAAAVGQVTPGPVFTTATFIGYLLDGPAGAALSTAGIFLPAFIFVAASAPFLPRLRRSALLGAALDGVNVASLAVMAVVTLGMTRAAIVDVPTAILGAASAIVLVATRVSSTWLILAGGATGLALGLAA
jgi:chromate transporter